MNKAVYDFENNLAEVFAAALTSLGVTAITWKSPAKVQSVRPRAEVWFVPGGATMPPRIALTPNFGQAISAYRGELSLECVTGVSTPEKDAHAQFRSQIRAAMELDRIRSAINDVPSKYCVQYLWATGTSITTRYQNGYETSTLTYAVDFSIQQDAWISTGTN